MDRNGYIPTRTNNLDSQYEIVVAVFANLLAYLGWLRGSEIFDGNQDDLVLTLPPDGSSRGLPPGVGAVKYTLLPGTKPDPTIVANVVLTFYTMSSLSPGKRALQLLSFESAIFGKLFSTRRTPVWTSHHFRHQFAIPFLNQVHLKEEPTLCSFSNRPGDCLKDKIYSMHSWR